jgi:cytochrome b
MSMSSRIKLPMKVWDAPTRLFHWGIVILLGVSWLSASEGWMQLHLLSGYTMLTALLFRLVWGFVGSDTARFAAFLTSPIAGLRHLSQFRRREPDTQVGHNAAGGWMVLVLLLLLAFQVSSGLFANTFDDLDVNGPFARLVSRPLSDRLSDLHAINFNIILGAVALHVLAVIAYAVLKGQDLVRPMVTGKKRLPGATRAPRMRSPLLALAVLVVAAALVAAIANQVWAM